MHTVTNSNLDKTHQHNQLQPLIRTKTHVFSICQNLNQSALQSRLSICPINRQISHLNISSNHISYIPKIHFNNLISLNVSHCLLKDQCIIQLEHLQRLDLSYNCLTKIPEIKSKKLKHLNLSNNQFVCLSEQLIKYQYLQQLKINNNQLTVFSISVLRKPFSKNVDIVKLIDLNKLQDLKEGVYSARYLIQRSFVNISEQSLRNLMIEAIKRQYQIGINILAENVKQSEQAYYLQFVEINNLNKSLETLLLSFRIQEGYDQCRIQSLNGQLFSYKNILSTRLLFMSLEQNIVKYYQKCDDFVKHIVSLGQNILNQNNIMQIVTLGNSEVIFLIFKNQIDVLSQIELAHQNPHLIKCLLQLDHQQLLLLLLDIPNFKSLIQTFFLTSAICSLLSPKYKIYKFILKLQKQLVNHQVSKKICLLRQYQSTPNTNIYTTTPMYNCGQDQLMIGYYQMQDPNPAPAEVIVKMNSQKYQKQNIPLVTQQVQKIRHSISGKKKLGLTLKRINDN